MQETSSSSDAANAGVAARPLQSRASASPREVDTLGRWLEGEVLEFGGARAEDARATLEKKLRLSQPTVHSHVNDMIARDLLRGSEEWEKQYPTERYYQSNFSIVRGRGTRRVRGAVGAWEKARQRRCES